MRSSHAFPAAKRRWILVILTAGGLAVAGCPGRLRDDWPLRAGGMPPSAVERADWAQPVPAQGVPNLHKVTANLYRGGQPTAEGSRELAAMGIRTVINLRSSSTDRDELQGTGLAYEHIWFRTWLPEEEDVVRFLRVATDPRRVPVFVHCQRGADRTGMMCAVYRIVVCGWTREEAVREMVEGPFGFDPGWRNLVDYVRRLDETRVARAVHAERKGAE